MGEAAAEAPMVDTLRQAAAPRAPATYVNYFELGQNPYEFLIDLGQYHPGVADGIASIGIHTRLVLTPTHAKLLSGLLARSVQEHEREYGPIPALDHDSSQFDIVLSTLGEFEDRARQLRAAHARPDSSSEPSSSSSNDR
jgi:hypothetical protein